METASCSYSEPGHFGQSRPSPCFHPLQRPSHRMLLSGQKIWRLQSQTSADLRCRRRTAHPKGRKRGKVSSAFLREVEESTCALHINHIARNRSVDPEGFDRKYKNGAPHSQCCSVAGAATINHLAQITAPSSLTIDPRILAVFGTVVVLVLALKKLFDTPSRKYDPDNPNVGDEYDAWTQ